MAYPVNHYPNDRFSDRLEAECARRGLDPTTTLPPLLGYNPSSVRQWLLGSSRPGDRSLHKLSELFGIPVSEWRGLLDGDGADPEPVPVAGEPVVQRRVCPDCHHALLDAGGTCPACKRKKEFERIARERVKIWKECGLPFEQFLDGWYQQGRSFRDWLAALGRLGHIG